MKTPQTIQLSRLRAPLREAKPVSVNYLEGFWLRLFWDIIISVRSLKYLRSGVSRSSRPQLKASSHTFSFQRAALLLWSLFWLSYAHPAPSHIVYADPMTRVAEITPLKPLPMPTQATQTPLETVFVSKLRDYGTYPNTFASLNCTSYVASRLPVTWSGDANQWAANAAALGYKVSAVPEAGTIAANTTDSYFGHVAIVAEIANGMVRLEEQNYAGPGVITSDRWAPIYEYVYIYV